MSPDYPIHEDEAETVLGSGAASRPTAQPAAVCAVRALARRAWRSARASRRDAFSIVGYADDDGPVNLRLPFPP